MLTPPDDLDSNNDGILDVATGWKLEEIACRAPDPTFLPITPAFSESGPIWTSTTRSLGVIDPVAGDVFLYKPIATAVPEPTVPEPSTVVMVLVGLLGILPHPRSTGVERDLRKRRISVRTNSVAPSARRPLRRRAKRAQRAAAWSLE